MAIKFADQVDLLLTPLLGLVLEPLASDPTGTDGRVYWNTASGEPRIYDGTSWGNLLGGEMTGAAILTALLTVDGSGSGLDADLLDGNEATYFAQATHNHTASDITDFTTEVNSLINATIDGAPSALDTLNELAAALGDDENFSTTITNLVNGKADTYSVQIGDGSATSYAITHNLGNTEAVCQVYEASSGDLVLTGIKRDSANQHTINFATAPSTNEYEVVVVA